MWMERRGMQVAQVLVGMVAVGCATAAGCKGCAARALTCPEGAVLIPAGTFTMGDDDDDHHKSPRPAHRVELTKPYCIDRTEVTMKALWECGQSGKCPFVEGIDATARTYPNRPAEFVNWEEARLYCEARGGRLPTEAEWEFAARGTDGRRYPWGNEPPADEHGRVRREGTSEKATDVGSYPKGRSFSAWMTWRETCRSGSMTGAGPIRKKRKWTPPGRSPCHPAKKSVGWRAEGTGGTPCRSNARANRRLELKPGWRSDQTGMRCVYAPR